MAALLAVSFHILQVRPLMCSEGGGLAVGEPSYFLSLPPTGTTSSHLAFLWIVSHPLLLTQKWMFLPRRWVHPPRSPWDLAPSARRFSHLCFSSTCKYAPIFPTLKNESSIFCRIPFKLFFHFFVTAQIHENVLCSCCPCTCPALPSLLFTPSFRAVHSPCQCDTVP